ncbi:hypothetical protein GINT2_002307 [Glugoides intestinalis]
MPCKMTFQKMVDYIKKKQKSLKIAVMGLDNAGKTSILASLFGITDGCAPTFGYKTHSVQYGEFKINLLDIGGQSCFREYWTNYFEKTNGILFVVDCTDSRSFADYLNDLIALQVPVCILINKIDLNPGFCIEDIREKMTELNNIAAFPTTIRDYESIQKGFSWLLNAINQIT